VRGSKREPDDVASSDFPLFDPSPDDWQHDHDPGAERGIIDYRISR
jgi:hypothetical protein